MKTATITAYGGPEVLAIDDVPIPEPRHDEALVAVVASTINPVDIKTRTPTRRSRRHSSPLSLDGIFRELSLPRRKPQAGGQVIE